MKIQTERDDHGNLRVTDFDSTGVPFPEKGYTQPSTVEQFLLDQTEAGRRVSIEPSMANGEPVFLVEVVEKMPYPFPERPIVMAYDESLVGAVTEALAKIEGLR